MSTPIPPTGPSNESTEPEASEVVARMAEFAQLAPDGAGSAPTLQFLHDVPVTISARLGQVTLPIADILKLGPGAILELDRDLSQPVELTVRGMTFARGEVVVVDDHFAIRIKELIQPRATRAKS